VAFFDQMGGGPTSNTGGPLASLLGGDPRQLMLLLSAGRVAGPNAMTPQLVQSGSPAGAPALNGVPMLAASPQQQLQQMMMRAGMGSDPSDPHSFLRALIGMDQGQFQRMLAMFGGGPGGKGV
jgi:hypothetical protein